MADNIGDEIARKLAPMFLQLGRKIDAFLGRPEPKVVPPEIKIPEIKIPEIKAPQVTVNVPEIKVPKIEIPEIKAPSVTVNTPDEMRIANLDEIPQSPPVDLEPFVKPITKKLQDLINKTGGASGPTEYKSGDVYGSSGVFGVAQMWEDTGSTMRTVSAAKPLPATLAAGTAAIGKVIRSNVLIPADYDYIALTYVAAGNGAGEIQTATYKTGGSGGTTVGTLTLAYNADNEISSITKS